MTAMEVKISKYVSPSSQHSAGGTTPEITLMCSSIKWNIKSALKKFKRYKSSNGQYSDANTGNGDVQIVRVIALKDIDESIVLNCVLEDDATRTAWEKFFILRAMCVEGNSHNEGACLSKFTLADKDFLSDDVRSCFLESVTADIPSNDTSNISERLVDGSGNNIYDVVRLNVTLDLYIGQDRINAQ